MGTLRIIRTGETYYDFDGGNAALGWQSAKPYVLGNVRTDQVNDEIATAIADRKNAILWLEKWQAAYQTLNTIEAPIMTNPSPAPWRYEFDGSARAFIIDDQGITIFVMSASPREHLINLRANVRLVSSVPDLLSALIAALETMDARSDDRSFDNVRQQARAAIVKATQ